jgi:uncharacterized protein (TIGR02996 family)
MDSIEILLEAVSRDPGDDGAWLVLADALEEQGDPRAEPTRLSVWLRRRPIAAERPDWEERVRALAKEGVRACLPQVTIGFGLDLTLVLIPPGTFLMGSPAGETGHYGDEELHWVTLTRGYWLGIHPLTQAQWDVLMPDNPSAFPGPVRPVEHVSWYECEDFCHRLSSLAERHFRLPTEAEWEYACRAGTSTPFYFGNRIAPDLANYDYTYAFEEGETGKWREETTPVGSFPANPWGLFDMSGNVDEWCQDYNDSYPAGEVTDPQGPETGEDRVRRGGSWWDYPWRLRSAFRYCFAPDERSDKIGCRVVMSVG